MVPGSMKCGKLPKWHAPGANPGYKSFPQAVAGVKKLFTDSQNTRCMG